MRVRFATVTSRSWLAAAIVVALSAPSVSTVGQSRWILSDQGIADAIAFGRGGDPSPYPLLHRQVSGQPGEVVVGAVYTPFVRVALMSKKMHAAGAELHPAAVPSALLEPIVYIAFRSANAGKVEVRQGSGFNALWIRRSSRLTRWEGTPPLWSSTDPDTLRMFAVDLPYDNIVLVAAFPVEALSVDYTFVVYRTFSDGAEFRLGDVRPSDIATWR